MHRFPLRLGPCIHRQSSLRFRHGCRLNLEQISSSTNQILGFRNLLLLSNAACFVKRARLCLSAAFVQSTRSVQSSSSVQCRKANADTSDQGKVELTRGDKVLRFIGWLGGFYSRKAILTRGAKTLYESCVDTVHYEEFFTACNLPDTFQSWFLIAHLHVWLCLVRLKREGKDGSLVIREVVSTFWYDVQQRMNVLGVHSSGVASWSLKELTHEFYGLTIAYEEGLLSDDKTLAAALWRNLIQDKSNTDPTQLARLVEYVRRQVKHMDALDSEHLLTDGRIQLLPFTVELDKVQP